MTLDEKEKSPLLILTAQCLQLQHHIQELLDAVIWDAYSSDDEFLEIEREIVEVIRNIYEK